MLDFRAECAIIKTLSPGRLVFQALPGFRVTNAILFNNFELSVFRTLNAHLRSSTVAFSSSKVL